MWAPKKILVPIDFSEDADLAVLHAVNIGRAYDSEIILFHVISLFDNDPNNPDYRFPDVKEIYSKLEEIASDNMQQLQESHLKMNFDQVVVRGISPAEEILLYEKENKIDLIVMGTHGRSGLRHFLIGSVAERVIRNAACPVMSIRFHKESEDFKPTIKRILVPIDFSTYSRQTLGYAVDIARRFDASLEIVHVIEEQVHPSYYVAGDISIFNLIPDLREKSLAALKEFTEKVIPEEIEHTFHIREGRAHSEIARFAQDQEIDLIVIATHGLSGLEHFLIGSTTEKVIRKVNQPVLAIKMK